MNFSRPIIICNNNEEFRFLIREMLMKHGFFHILEASNAEETHHLLTSEKEPITIIQSELLNPDLLDLLDEKKKFVVIAQAGNPKSIALAARFGVKCLLSFPFSSQALVEKINGQL